MTLKELAEIIHQARIEHGDDVEVVAESDEGQLLCIDPPKIRFTEGSFVVDEYEIEDGGFPKDDFDMVLSFMVD